MSATSSRKAFNRLDDKRTKFNRSVTPNTTRLRSPQDDTYLVNREGQEQWEKEMRTVTQTTDREVAVLLLSWENAEEHSMNTTAELDDLTKVFEDKYNFQVYTELLSTQNPQQPRYQLNSIFNNFLSKHDKPGTLLIIYYGGHGTPTENGEELRLLGGNPDERDRGSTELNWNDVEPALYRLSADLLLVFDCCYAGLVARNKRVWPASRSHFEFIGSTAFDKTARGPRSRGSFTRAMIEVLNSPTEDEDFTTAALVHQTVKSKVFYKTRQQPVISECGKTNSFRRLKLMPQEKHVRKESSSGFESDDTINFYLHLKYVFRQKPSQEHLRALADRLNDMVKNDNLPIANVLWEGLSEYNPRMSMSDAARMVRAKLGHVTCNKTAGRLEITASTRKPSTLLQRTLTTLTVDGGPLRGGTSLEAESKDPGPAKTPRSSQRIYRVATVPFTFRPVCKLRTAVMYFVILGFPLAVTFSWYRHVFQSLHLR